MCGICGIVDYTGRPIEHEDVERMRDVMVDRGPDDAGTKILPYVGLGHRRLSIIDLSERGHQPMCNEDGSVWLVFNGEIYNFLDLRPDLERAGHRFVSDTDSEVLVHGYEQWGIEGLLERINGMFAFALWDASGRVLHLARDRLGKKPLYYGWLGSRFLFASDIKALWAYDPGGFQVDRAALSRFLYWRYFPGRETVFANVRALLPAHVLRLNDRGQRETRYWRLSYARKVTASASDVLDGSAEVIARAVRRRLRSDVPLGAFLSGGVDSSYVVSWMNGQSEHTVRTFAIGTEDPLHDERGAARRVAEHLRTNHTEFQVTPDAWSLLPKMVWAFGQPFGDAAAVPTHYVAQCARQHVTVALTGDGGDESFAGYSNHHGWYLAGLLKRLLPTGAIEYVLDRGKAGLDSTRRHAPAAAIRFLRYTHPDPIVALGSVTTWSQHHLTRIWSRDSADLTSREVLLGYALDVLNQFDGISPLDEALHLDLNVQLPFCYNVKVDVATMMSSLEARCPFQDREVVEWAARLDPAIKLRRWEKKYLLKRLAARRVPPEVVYRAKHGFSIPLGEWFRSWGDKARAILLGPTAVQRGLFNYPYIQQLWEDHQARRADHGTRLWLLLWLELWFRMFVDRTLHPTDPMPVH